MDSKRRYIEVKEDYEIDEWFEHRLEEISTAYKFEVIAMAVGCLHKLPSINSSTQFIGGYIPAEEHIFFEIEFYKTDEKGISLMDIYVIEPDDYLDYVIENRTIKSYTNGVNFKRKNRAT